MYGVRRTTIYLPESLKRQLESAALEERCTEAELIRRGLARLLQERATPRPRAPLFSSGIPDLAERCDELLSAFGDS